MQPRYHPSLDRELVVRFTMCRYDVAREVATKGVRKTLWGYRVLDPFSEITGLVAMGNGPTVVHGDTGVFIPLSSSPSDIIGPHGFGSLKTVEDVDAMIERHHRMSSDTIEEFIQDCARFHAEQGKPHVHDRTY